MIIFHTGDIHLDSPFSGFDSSTSDERRRDLRDTFERMMNYAKSIKADLVLIAGDLFDEGFATRETIAFLIKCFKNVNCPVIIAPGNHDPYNSQSIWSKKLFPENVYVFDSPVLNKFHFEDLDCNVYGWAFTSRNLKECPINTAKIENSNSINILLAHADVSSPLSPYCPISRDMINSFGADYTALGHIHNSEKVNEFLGDAGSYCGCPEGRDFGECGVKGANVIEVTKSDGDLKKNVSFVRFCQKTYEVLSVDCESASNSLEIIEKINVKIDGRKDKNVLLRVVLTGSVYPTLVIDTESLSKKIQGFSYVEVVDSTTPTAGADFYINDKGIRGEIYRVLLPKMESSDYNERETARKAFKYAISALNGENLTDN